MDSTVNAALEKCPSNLKRHVLSLGAFPDAMFFKRVLPAGLPRRLLAVCFIVLADTLLILTSAHLRMNFAASGFVHLILVVVTALTFGFWPATLISILANLGMNMYLVPPLASLGVSDPQNLIALFVFELCALIVSQLSVHARRQSTLAISHRMELEKLYSFTRRLLLLNRSEPCGAQIVLLMQDEFSTAAALFLDATAASPDVLISFPFLPHETTQMEAALMAACQKNEDCVAGDRFFISVMRTGSTPIGAIGLKGLAITPFLVATISALCAIALEREKSFEREARKSAEQKSEQLRAAVLDSLAHEYKTPLTAIRAAAGGLLELGELEPIQLDLVKLIDRQTRRLDALTTKLLQTADLDRKDIKLRLELIDAEDLVTTVIHKLGPALACHPVKTELNVDGLRLHADRDLIVTALAQYVDNAAKYSNPESPITIAVRPSSAAVTISVHNTDSYLPKSELERIFDRFHRAPSTQNHASGTGIGLSIVSKVASAHQGRAWVTSDLSSGTTFFLALPSGHESAVKS